MNTKGDYANLEHLSVKEVLSENLTDKIVTLLATDKDENKAVVLISKRPFESEDGQKILNQCDLKLDLKNDIYHSFDAFLPSELQHNRISLTYPATDRHIEKARAAEQEFLIETPEIYNTITKAYIDEQKNFLQWVYNILEKDASKCNEIERIVFEDKDSKNGFLILPDLKWDQKTNRDLHCTALVNDRSLHSLRDLNSDHIPLLENLLINGTKAIVKKYGFKENQVRMYFHYPPSHYHLHCHFTANTVSHGCLTERAHMLHDVIENIKIKSDYYQIRDLTISLIKGSKIHSLLTYIQTAE